MRQTLQSLFGLELSTAQKVIVASVVILVLLALLGLFVRQIQGGRLRLRGQAGGASANPGSASSTLTISTASGSSY